MRRTVRFMLALALLVTAAAQFVTQAVARRADGDFLTIGSTYGVRRDSDLWLGWRGTVGANSINVSHLCKTWHTGNTGSTTVKIVRLSGAEVASASVSLASGTNGQFNCTSIAPVTLAANTAYAVVFDADVSTGNDWYDSANVSPASVMSVQESVRSADLASFVNSGYGANTAYGVVSFKYQLPPSGPGQWAASGNHIYSTNTGNVGVGTQAPADKLHVYSAANGGRGLGIDAGGTQAEQHAYLNFFTSGDGAKVMGTAGTRGWHFTARGNAYGAVPAQQNDLVLYNWNGVGWRDVMHWDNAGNVGVGTSTPNFKLDVQGGRVNASDGLCIAGDCKAAWSQVFGSSSTMSAANISSGQFGAGAGGGAFSFPNNVGVGTTTPSFKLDVQGGRVNASGGLCIAGDCKENWSQVGGGGGSSPWETSGSNIIYYNAGNVGIGTAAPAAKLDVAGNINVSGNINAKYQDVAEWVPSVQALAPGTVVALDPSRSNHVMAAALAYDTRVAGVISAMPGISLGEAGPGRVLVATTGRVRVKVDARHAPIRVGDLLVASDFSGFAMRSEAMLLGGALFHRPGTIIGKALEPLESGTGEILVLLSLQ